MGKDQESLEESILIRNYLKSKWGRVPSSIWEVDWRVKVEDFSKSYGDFQKEQELKYGKAFSLSSVGHSKDSGGLSKFPQDICRFLINFYTDKGDNVLDPFTGHNSRMESCYICERNYIGNDISAQFTNWNYEIRDWLYEKNQVNLTKKTNTITLTLGDSRYFTVEPESMDFCITSPPFYNVEYYGDEPEQLGRARTYNDFLYGLGLVVKNCFNGLKPGSYIAWEVNDFRDNGQFYVYHYDTIRLFQQAGFLIHDIIIVDYGSSFLASFLSDVEHNKIMPKQHSYIIVGKKMGVGKRDTRVETREKLLEAAKKEIGTGINNTDNQSKLF